MKNPPVDYLPSLQTELNRALRSSASAFLGIGVFSFIINILMLAGAFFMLQVYDRVLPSQSVPTLAALAILATGLFLALGILDMIRSRVLSRIGVSIDAALSRRVHDIIVRLPLKTRSGDGLQPARDLDAIRSFLSCQGPAALFDLPWMPVYLAIIFAMHPMLGLTALVGTCILVLLTVLTEVLTRQPMTAAAHFNIARNSLAEGNRRNAEVLTAMGMAGRLGDRWLTANSKYTASNLWVSDLTSGIGAFSRAFRMMLQSAVLGVGAYFVIQGEASAGIIIAGSILVSRALAPIDLAIANWKGFVAARQSATRLSKHLTALPARTQPMALPAPHAKLTVENVIAAPPSSKKVVVQDVKFMLTAGQSVGVIGHSGSGKSSLARLLVGVWQPLRGQVRLDGAALSQWSPEALGRHIGYLPQDVELFAGTVAENISRFEPKADPKAIIAAARSAGVHDLIVSLPDGYDTELGEQGQAMSAGQRQRVALARALYGNPFLVVLDEPNSNLDAEGEAALSEAIRAIRDRGGIAVVVAHRRSALKNVDNILVMAQGRMKTFGPKDDVVAAEYRPTIVKPNPLKLMPAGPPTQ